jgi:hypothetical protein
MEGALMATTFDDDLVFLIADVHKSTAEAVELRRKSHELRDRWEQNHAEIRTTARMVGANSLDKVEARRHPLVVRRWPGVYGEPS